MEITEKKTFLYKLFLFFFASSNFLLIIKQNLLEENSVLSITIIYGFLYSILTFQILILLIINKFLKKYFNFFFIFLLFYNLYSLNISLSSEFTILPRIEKLTNLSIYFFVYLILIYFFLKNLRILKLIIIVYIFFNVFYLFNLQNILNKVFDGNKYQVEFTQSKFKKTPNIYIYSIESLMTDNIVKNHIGVEKSYYMDTLKDNNFVIFDNHFSDDYSTRNSLNSMLSIDQELWKKNKKDYFSGRSNSPLFDILKNNNYKIFTGFHDSHFGPPGNYVDGYFTFRSIKLSNKIYEKYYVNYCQFKMPWYHLQLFNYCEFLEFFLNIDNSQKLDSLEKFERYIMSFIKEESLYNKFVVFHQLTHSHPTHSTKNWTKYFIESRKKTVAIINELTQNIKLKDPNAILIIIGDHGPSLLKTSVEKKFHENIMKTYKNNKELSYVIDRFYTVGAILDNSSICTSDILNLKKRSYTTNSMLLNYVLSCLFENEKFTAQKLSYSIPGYKDTPLKNGGRYEDYLFYN